MLKFIIQSIVSTVVNSIIKCSFKNKAPVEDAKPIYEKSPRP